MTDPKAALDRIIAAIEERIASIEAAERQAFEAGLEFREAILGGERVEAAAILAIVKKEREGLQ